MKRKLVYSATETRKYFFEILKLLEEGYKVTFINHRTHQKFEIRRLSVEILPGRKKLINLGVKFLKK